MMRTMYGRRLSLLVLALALVAAACSGGGGDTADSEEPTDVDTEAGTDDSEEPSEEPSDGEASETEADTGGEASGGSISMYLGEPESLVSINSNESEGGFVIRTINAGLVEFDEEANALFGEDDENAVAESIETEDGTMYTVTLKEGFTFHDGSPVRAQDYVDTWNYAAFAPNAQNGQYFFGQLGIAGAEDLNCPDDECAEQPPATELSGLEVVDEQTFTVTLDEPNIEFTQAIGYSVFYALPPAFFEDPEAFNEQPIGNGPFMLTGPWEHNVQIPLGVYEDFPGTRPQVDEVTLQIYGEIETAYNDLLGGNLDIMDSIPPEQIANAEADLGDRFVSQPSSTFQFVGFPTYQERFADPRIRQALSLAIPRQLIATEVFNDTRVPADSFVSPAVDGYREGACEFLVAEPDTERAQQLYTEAGGTTEPMVMLFNSGAGHDAWIGAIANAWRETFGITEITFQQLDFSEYGPLLENQQAPGPYRLGWLFDWPSPENYLTPLAGTGSSSNYTGYASEEFDALMDQGRAADDRDAATELYNQAEDILCQDMPYAPALFSNTTAASSENVDNVVFDLFGEPRLEDVTVVS